MSKIEFITSGGVEKINEFKDLAPDEQRPVSSYSSRRWTYPFVMYTLDSSFSHNEKEAIKAATAEITDHTCFGWLEENISPRDSDYVSIEKSSTCQTVEGRKGGKQILSLTSSCCTERGIILHLLLHAMGLMDEHLRPDRDDYISVNMDNVMDDRKHLFRKYESVAAGSLDMEYNYRSVMHYTSTLFAKDKSIPVLSRKLCDVQTSDLGDGLERGYLTKEDLRNINILYECAAHFFED